MYVSDRTIDTCSSLGLKNLLGWRYFRLHWAFKRRSNIQTSLALADIITKYEACRKTLQNNQAGPQYYGFTCLLARLSSWRQVKKRPNRRLLSDRRLFEDGFSASIKNIVLTLSNSDSSLTIRSPCLWTTYMYLYNSLSLSLSPRSYLNLFLRLLILLCL